jgi:hypothetical protein
MIFEMDWQETERAWNYVEMTTTDDDAKRDELRKKLEAQGMVITDFDFLPVEEKRSAEISMWRRQRETDGMEPYPELQSET